MKCNTCGTELYKDGACPLMCVWTSQPEAPTFTFPIRVKFKAVIASKNWLRVVKA